jgi:NAD(P)-dependent dehydrogenase (short-subunit alcohol dehydrogenase family)
MRLSGKVALITGGGSGIGRACASLFADHGARVSISDFRYRAALEVSDMIISRGGESLALTGDVSIGNDARMMVDTTVERFGRLDVLVNSAGVSARNALGNEASEEEIWDRVMEVNLKGTYQVSSYALPYISESGGGSIINLASVMSLVGYQGDAGSGLGPYPPSKGGVLQFTRNLAIEVAKKKIRVNCLCPGYVETSLIEGMISDEDVMSQLVARHPIGRLGKPEEIAYAALYLASDESTFVTGAPLVVDGGYTAQ